MNVGIYDGLSQHDYRAAAGVSTSFLKAFAHSPAKARFGEHETTPALESGTLIHAAILEPETLDTLYQATDQPREGTTAWEREERLAMGRKLIKRADYDDARRMRDAIAADPEAADLLKGVAVEQSFWWHDRETGLLRKGRTDAVNHTFHVMLDVKTCEDSSKAAFRTAVSRYRYHWQEASYVDGWTGAGGWHPQGFVFIAIEKTRPFLIGKYQIDPEDVQTARNDLDAVMPAVVRCLETDRWPTNRDSLVQLDPLPLSAHLGHDITGLFA